MTKQKFNIGNKVTVVVGPYFKDETGMVTDISNGVAKVLLDKHPEGPIQFHVEDLEAAVEARVPKASAKSTSETKAEKD